MEIIGPGLICESHAYFNPKELTRFDIISLLRSPSPELTPPPDPTFSRPSVRGSFPIRGAMASRGAIRNIRKRRQQHGEEMELTDLIDNTIESGKEDLTKPNETLSPESRRAKLTLRVIFMF